MKLSDLVHGPSIVPELKATDRNGVIRELVQSLGDHGAIAAEQVETICRATIAREKQGSTGFGKGVAVPHVKHESLKKMIATIGRSSRGEWGKEVQEGSRGSLSKLVKHDRTGKRSVFSQE